MSELRRVAQPSTEEVQVADKSITIAVESPLQDDVRAMVAALNAFAFERTPKDHCHHLTIEQMAQPDTTVFVARNEAGVAIGMGALKRYPGGVGEVKRMYTAPEARGAGIGGAIVAEIEALARCEGFTQLVLETGTNFDAAKRVYARAGFSPCAAVLDYPPSPWTAFYEKALQ